MTQRQLDRILVDCLCGKHWTDKREHCIRIIKPFYPDIHEDNLQWFLEIYYPAQIEAVKKEVSHKIKTGIINNNYTPTDVDGSFSRVDNPEIGKIYHISWAHKGSKFKLVKLIGDLAYLDNPKNKRKSLLKVNISNLRNLRKVK